MTNDSLPSGAEMEILVLMARGWKNTEISERLGTSVNTVKWRLKRLYARYGFRSRADAVASSIRFGWIEP